MATAKKTYASVDPKAQSPLRLPSLKVPGSSKKPGGNQRSGPSYSGVQLQTVLEKTSYTQAQDKHLPGKFCASCARKHKVEGICKQSTSVSKKENKTSINNPPSIKGAPYYQQLTMNKALANANNAGNAPRSSSNIRNGKRQGP